MMPSIYLFDTFEIHENLLPLSYTRPIADFRVGIVTIREKWEGMAGIACKYLPLDYLKEKYGEIIPEDEENYFVVGNLLPDNEIIREVINLEPGEGLTSADELIAFRGPYSDFKALKYKKREARTHLRRINYVFEIFTENKREIESDFKRLTAGKTSAELPSTTRLIGDLRNEDGSPRLFIEEGAEIECASINVKRGVVYIGKDTLLMEGATLRGPLAICEGVKIRMGAKIYGSTTFGPYCKMGGEIDNTVVFGYSNKAHDGFLGNAVIGEWCNIGAGVNASNLKNDYSKIRLWNYHMKTFMRTDLQFCGLIMGDHSKIGINCMLNTATVVGVGVNIHGSGFPRVFVPSFREGSPGAGFGKVPYKKFMEIAARAMSRRHKEMDDKEAHIYEHLHSREWPEKDK